MRKVSDVKGAEFWLPASVHDDPGEQPSPAGAGFTTRRFYGTSALTT